MDSNPFEKDACAVDDNLSEHLLVELPDVAPHHLSDAINVGEQTRILFRAWHKVLNGRRAPKRADITMAQVRGAVHWLWVARRESDVDDYRMRLIGDGIVSTLGRNDTGKRLSEFPTSHFTRHLQALCKASHQMGHPFRVGPMTTKIFNKGLCVVELSAVPLSDDGETITSLMGTFELHSRLAA